MVIGLPPGDGTAVLDLSAERQLVGLHAFLGETDLTSIVEIKRDPAQIAQIAQPRPPGIVREKRQGRQRQAGGFGRGLRLAPSATRDQKRAQTDRQA